MDDGDGVRLREPGDQALALAPAPAPGLLNQLMAWAYGSE
jgi:hypothetical protein